MTQANIEYQFNSEGALQLLQEVSARLGDPAPLLRAFGEHLLHTTKGRFDTQTGPDGTRWAALSPRYQKRKKYNADKILTLNGYLRGTLHYQVGSGELLLGSNLPYARRQQFGGEFQVLARSQYAYFKMNKKGEVGNRFVKKSKSNFKQGITIGEHTVKTPARPFLGVSAADEQELLAIAGDFILPENP